MFFVLTNLLGLASGFFSATALTLWIIEIALYLICDIIFSIRQSDNKFKLLISLSPVFPILHISYGIGFLEGLIVFYIFKSSRLLKKNTEVSR
jgi:hypothetical protein